MLTVTSPPLKGAGGMFYLKNAMFYLKDVMFYLKGMISYSQNAIF